MPKQFRLKGPSLDAIRRKAEEQHGPGARIVAAEKVTNPGIAGLFAANRFEAIVELPAGGGPAAGPDAPRGGPAGLTTAVAGSVTDSHRGLHGPAIAALLEQADASELRLAGGGTTAPAVAPAAPASTALVSTAGPDFAGLLEQLGRQYRSVPALEQPGDHTTVPGPGPGAAPGTVAPAVGHFAPRTAPAPLTGAGDLVLLLGLGDDALGPALEMSLAAGGCDVRTGGSLTAYGHLHVHDRQGATAARAEAVLTGQAVVLAFGLGRPRDVAGHAALVASLAADQLWAVADARRKPEDTAAWLGQLGDRLAVDALAVVGAEDTLSPGTVNGLGLPVGWQDGRKVH